MPIALALRHLTLLLLLTSNTCSAIATANTTFTYSNSTYLRPLHAEIASSISPADSSHSATSPATSQFQQLSPTGFPGIGDYIAAGVGIRPVDPTTDVGELLGGSTTSLTFATLRLNETGSTNPNIAGINSTANSKLPSATGAFATNHSVELCWTSWEDYWTKPMNTYSEVPVKTISSTTVETRTWSAVPASTWVVTLDEVPTSVATYHLPIMDGGFTISTSTQTTTYTGQSHGLSTGTYTSEPGSTATDTYTRIETQKSTWRKTITEPPCALPSYVSQCQTQWLKFMEEARSSHEVSSPLCNGAFEDCRSSQDAWYSQHEVPRYGPICTQASMPADVCWYLRDSYVHSVATRDPTDYYPNGRWDGEYWTSWKTNGTTEDGYRWPSGTTLAPSCTLGCARCAITAGTIDLLYWPTTGSYISGQTMTTLNTTLTYPTMYVSYSQLHANDSCGLVGPTIRNTMLPVPTTAQVSSVYGVYTAQYVWDHAGASFRPGVATVTTSFNVTDLNEPVPYSIYSRQPWCQTYLMEHGAFASLGSEGLYNTSIVPPKENVSCPTTVPYKPILYLPSDILTSLDPLWATCSGDLRGAYDPPHALQPASTQAMPTVPNAASTTAASQASTVEAPTPSATGNVASQTEDAGSSSAFASQSSGASPTELSAASPTELSAASQTELSAASPTESSDPSPSESSEPSPPSNSDAGDPSPSESNAGIGAAIASAAAQLATSTYSETNVNSGDVDYSEATAADLQTQTSRGEGSVDGQPTESTVLSSTGAADAPAASSVVIGPPAPTAVTSASQAISATAPETVNPGSSTSLDDDPSDTDAQSPSASADSDASASPANMPTGTTASIDTVQLGDSAHATQPGQIASAASYEDPATVAPASNTMPADPDASVDSESASGGFHILSTTTAQAMSESTPTLSADSNGMVTGDNTQQTATFPPDYSPANNLLLTLKSSTITASNAIVTGSGSQNAVTEAVVIDGTATLVEGGAATTIDDHAFSMASAGLVQDGSLVWPSTSSHEFAGPTASTGGPLGSGSPSRTLELSSSSPSLLTTPSSTSEATKTAGHDSESSTFSSDARPGAQGLEHVVAVVILGGLMYTGNWLMHIV